MQGTDRLQELTVFFQKNSGKILSGRCNLALTTHSLAHLNRHLKQSEEHEVFNDSGGSHDRSEDRRHGQTLVFLLNYVRKTPALKLIHPTSTLQGSVEVTRFKGLTMLEIKKVPLHMLTGLGCLRHQLQVLICSRCVQTLKSLLCSCGGDMLSEAPWSALHTLNVSYNHIDALDDSLRLLPVLKMLDISHNNLRTTRDYLECLSELAHLNLGYNRLEAVPSLGLVARTNLKTLVLRNNGLERLSGLEECGSLLELDLGNNCVYEASELRTLGYLHNLREVNLLGNPLTFDPNYRPTVISKFPPEGGLRKMYLDGTPVSSIECKMIPQRSLNRPLIRPPSLTSLDTVGSSCFNEISSFEESTDVDRGKRSSRGRRAPKVRHVSIPDQGALHKDNAKPRGPRLDSDIQDTKREMEKMRQQHGQDWLLALQAPYGQSPNTSASDTERPPGYGGGSSTTAAKATRSHSLVVPSSSGIESDINSRTVGGDAGRDHSGNRSAADTDRDPASSDAGPFAEELVAERVAGQTAEASLPHVRSRQHRAEETGATQAGQDPAEDSKPTIFLESQRPDVEVTSDSPWTEAQPENEDTTEQELCSPLLVTLEDPGQDTPVHLFLTVKETHLEETDFNGHLKDSLELSCLRSMDHTLESVWSDTTGTNLARPLVNLTFDYIRRDRQKREYVLENEESYKILIQTLQPVLDKNRREASTREATFQCLKCSSEFSLCRAKWQLVSRQRGTSRGAVNLDEDKAGDIETWMNEVPVCPSCGSELIVELESPLLPSNSASNISTPIGSLGSTDLNLKPVATSSPWKLKENDGIYLSANERNRSGSSTEYHSAVDSLSPSPTTRRPAAHSSSSGTSTLIGGSAALSPADGRQRHITEESAEEESASRTLVSSLQGEERSGESNFELPDPTVRLSRAEDETDPLKNLSTYQHEKLLQLLQENMAPFSHKYSLVPPDILDGAGSSREASGANTPSLVEPPEDIGAGLPSPSSGDDAGQRAEGGSRRTSKTRSAETVREGRNESRESCNRMQNGNSGPCSEDDIVVLPLERKPDNEGPNPSLEGLDDNDDAPRESVPDEAPPIHVGRAGSTDSEIAVLRNSSVDAVSIASDSVFDSSLGAAQTNLANALSDAASRLEIVSSSPGTSANGDLLSELETSGTYPSPNREARSGKARPGSRQSQSSAAASRESSLTASLEVGEAVPRRKSSILDPQDGDFSNADHRLKLYFSMSLFGDKEDLACMTKCQIYQFSKTANFPGLLVISTLNIYIMKVSKEESEKPSDFLAKRCQHALRDLHLVHVGPGSQAFQLDFVNEGVLYTIVTRDADVSEAFVAQLERAAKGVPSGKKTRFKGVERDHPNTTMNLMCQVFGESLVATLSGERETELNLYLLAYRVTPKKVKRAMGLDFSPVSVLITPGDLYLVEENHFWPLRQTRVKGQARTTQFNLVDHHKMTDVSEVELYEDAELDLSIIFFSEDTEQQSCWTIQTVNAASLSQLVDAVRMPWRDMFEVDLKTSIKPSISIDNVDLLD